MKPTILQYRDAKNHASKRHEKMNARILARASIEFVACESPQSLFSPEFHIQLSFRQRSQSG
jgi:hypothetical protein